MVMVSRMRYQLMADWDEKQTSLLLGRRTPPAALQPPAGVTVQTLASPAHIKSFVLSDKKISLRIAASASHRSLPISVSQESSPHA